MQSSPSHSQSQIPSAAALNKPSTSSHSTNRNGKRHQTQQTKPTGAGPGGTHRVGTSKVNGRSSGSVNQAPAPGQPALSGNHRSMSTGRNQKSAHGSRGVGGGKQSGGTAGLLPAGQQSKTTRAHAINEAYN